MSWKRSHSSLLASPCVLLCCVFTRMGASVLFPFDSPAHGLTEWSSLTLSLSLSVPLKQEFNTLNAGDFWITSWGSGSSPLNDPSLWRDLGGRRGVFRPSGSLVGTERLEFGEFFFPLSKISKAMVSRSCTKQFVDKEYYDNPSTQ